MPHHALACHDEFIAAAPVTVRAQFADIEHHIHHQVHPRLRFKLLQRRADGARFVQEVRLLGLRQRDVFERRLLPDGSIEDESVEGFNRGGTLRFQFEPQRVAGVDGTLVRIEVRLPLPPVLGRLVRPLLEAQIRRELREAARQDRADIEQHGYPRTAPVGAALDGAA